MKLRVDGRTYCGRALDVHGVDSAAVARAVRGRSSRVALDAPDPGPVHERVGHLHPGLSLSLRSALAAAARSRGYEAPRDDRIETLEERLATIEPPRVDRREARKRAAEAGQREDHLHERVAELRGRIQALREREEDASDAQARLRETAAELTDARTERIAAQERLDRLEERHREANDRRERRLRLRDRLDNLRREARKRLARQVYDRFRSALRVVPGDATPGDRPAEFEGEELTAALAVARVADISAPLVVSCGQFSDAPTAADLLDAPVVRVAG